jgi:hypothetical protein
MRIDICGSPAAHLAGPAREIQNELHFVVLTIRRVDFAGEFSHEQSTTMTVRKPSRPQRIAGSLRHLGRDLGRDRIDGDRILAGLNALALVGIEHGHARDQLAVGREGSALRRKLGWGGSRPRPTACRRPSLRAPSRVLPETIRKIGSPSSGR